MSERLEMECKRCGDNEDRIDGFCSKECKDKYSLEEALSKMNIRIKELVYANIEMAKGIINLKARIAELEEQLKEAVQYEVLAKVRAGEGSWAPLKKEREE